MNNELLKSIILDHSKVPPLTLHHFILNVEYNLHAILMNNDQLTHAPLLPLLDEWKWAVIIKVAIWDGPNLYPHGLA